MNNIKNFFVVVMAVMALSATAQVERPKLVVGLVVDQMRWDYLYNYSGGKAASRHCSMTVTCAITPSSTMCPR